jgi:hypothetical protein
MADPSPFAKLAALYSRNGASTNSLDLALSRVTIAERNLEEARSTARVVARREGVPLANLFGKTQFIARSSGERWADEARVAGAEERTLVIIKALKAARDPDPRYRDAAEALRRGMERGLFDGILGAAVSTADAADDDDDEVEAARVEAEARTNAAAILKAAALRDAGGPRVPEPAGKAKRILDAARRAHRRQGDD